jgi:hypothetical protein
MTVVLTVLLQLSCLVWDPALMATAKSSRRLAAGINGEDDEPESIFRADSRWIGSTIVRVLS